MNDIWAIACGTGLQDGLNPCIFMACAVFISLGLWTPPQQADRLRIIFVLVYAAAFLALNFGPAQIFVFQKGFIFAAKVLYFILGAWAFISGILFFKDWVLIRRGQAEKVPADRKTGLFAGNILIVLLTTIILALALSALGTLWPVNYYIMLMGNEAFLRGQWQSVIPLLAGYILSNMWPLWFVWAFLSIKNLQPSLLKIFCAAIFFTASSCMIFIFK